jgi:hypothetical protein
MARVNMSAMDRWIRVGIVVIIAGLLYTHTLIGWTAVILGLISFAFFVSSFTGFCPVYGIFRLNTARRSRA